MGRSRDSANLVSNNNIFVDIVNDRVGFGVTTPTTKVQVAGNVTAVDFNSTSDFSLKENITTVDNALQKIESIRGVKFSWKETKSYSYGVIAQEVEDIAPELVHGTNTKTVNYNGIIGILIEAVKEQQKQINTLKEEIQSLKK
jgi:hypothetical protein